MKTIITAIMVAFAAVTLSAQRPEMTLTLDPPSGTDQAYGETFTVVANVTLGGVAPAVLEFEWNFGCSDSTRQLGVTTSSVTMTMVGHNSAHNAHCSVSVQAVADDDERRLGAATQVRDGNLSSPEPRWRRWRRWRRRWRRWRRGGGPEPNQPPTVTLACDPCEVGVGEEVTLTADATDPDGDDLA